MIEYTIKWYKNTSNEYLNNNNSTQKNKNRFLWKLYDSNKVQD